MNSPLLWQQDNSSSEATLSPALSPQGRGGEWILAGCRLSSRLLVGTAGYPNLSILEDALAASGTGVVTVGIRRVNLREKDEPGLLRLVRERGYRLLPNTAGCYTAAEAILTAQLARESLETDWIKLEVISDSYSLYPANEELLKAARELVRLGFTVLPYCADDPIVCKKLVDAGCPAVMPLAAPIGSGQGIRNRNNLLLIRKTVSVPLIVDAGVGTASDAAIAMEIGCDGILINTAIAKAKDPVRMAAAMKRGVEAGRIAFESGRIPIKQFATPSTPERGKIESRKS